MTELKAKLDHKTSQLKTLKKQSQSHLAKTKRSRFRVKVLEDVASGSTPTTGYEDLRRRIYSNTKDLWHYMSNQLEEATITNITLMKIRIILTEVADRKRSLLHDQEKLLQSRGYEEWGRKEAASVSDLVQRRLRYLQNPAVCSSARKLICNLNKSGGFSHQVHHVVYCLIIAYATERTLILHSRGWQYNYTGWETLFHSLSETCARAYDETALEWPVTSYVKVVSVPILEKMSPKPKFVPPVVPHDLAFRIARFTGDAPAWWVGQILKYVLKPLHSVQEVIDIATSKIDFKSPIVGVHIRHNSKGGYHGLEEYMAHVDDYYKQRELTESVDKRRVYLATNEAGCLKQAQKNYPEYIFYGTPEAVHPRTMAAALTGLLVDLQVLSKCDYVVTTFSSNVGRMAYELMHTKRVDASESFYSLDESYSFSQVFGLDRIAVVNNKGVDHFVSFNAGDQLAVVPRRKRILMDGYGYRYGVNKHTRESGLIPMYKTMEHLWLQKFPEYKQVPIYSRPNTRTTQTEQLSYFKS